MTAVWSLLLLTRVYYSWLDKTPSGRIIARCTEDIQTRKCHRVGAFNDGREGSPCTLTPVDGRLANSVDNARLRAVR